MPPVRSLVSIYCVLLAISISLNSEIISFYSYYVKKGLVCIIIAASFGCQPSSCVECTKSNMRLSCNVKLVSDAECL